MEIIESSHFGDDIFKLKTFCLITGASKGYGRCMAEEFAKLFINDSIMFLTARSENLLIELKKQLSIDSPNITVLIESMDFNDDQVDFHTMFKNLLNCIGKKASDFQQGIIIHNAASMGDITKKATEISCRTNIRKYLDLNVTSVIALNTEFFKWFNRKTVEQIVVINITSICSIQPFKTWSMYCSGKACRDMLFRTMAIEEPDIRILNWAPGPLNTDMQLIARSETGDEELKTMFKDMHENGTLLTCRESVAKLINLLQENSWNTGAHIDFYDI